MNITTDLQVKNAKLPAGATEKYIAIPGHSNLCLRLRPGRKDWFFRYRLNDGPVKKIHLGKYPDIGLKAAQNLARDNRELLENQTDPQVFRKQQEIAQQTAKAVAETLPQTVEDLFNLWEKTELRYRSTGNGKYAGRFDDGASVRRAFEKDVFPKIGSLPPSTVRRANLLAVIDEIKHRGSPRMAGVVLTDMRQMFGFALDREIIDTDPSSGLSRKKHGGNANERERVLTDEEIKMLALAAPKTLISRSNHAVWIMLSTCCRIGEITKAKWSEVNLDSGEWFIPEDNAKNRKALTINLSDFALMHFRALRAYAEENALIRGIPISEWIMPARHRTGHVCPKSLRKQITDRQRIDNKPMSRRSPLTKGLVLPGGKWLPHDLRRTGATLMGNLGIRGDVIEKCLNHNEPNRIKRIYQRQEMRPEMTEAWRLLGERLELLTNRINGKSSNHREQAT